MKLQKVTMDKAGDALVTAGAATLGFGASNAGKKAVESLVKNKMASMGIVAGLGLLGTIALPNKHLKALSAGVIAKQVYDGAKMLVADHASDVEILADAFEVTPAATVPSAMGALRSKSRRRMGNPNLFRMGNAVPTQINEETFVLG
jgi:pyruvate dehydrogenase complex dehydrogenase (E1) component